MGALTSLPSAAAFSSDFLDNFFFKKKLKNRILFWRERAKRKKKKVLKKKRERMGKEKGMKIWREIIRQGRKKKNAHLGVNHQLRRAEEEKDRGFTYHDLDKFIYLSFYFFV